MKNKTKLLFGSVISSSVIACSAPLISLSGCSDKGTVETGNLMKEYTPESPKLDITEISNWDYANDVINKYFSEIQKKSKYFVEDLLYTMSRGLATYNQLLEQKGIKINSNDFNATIDEVNADIENYQLSFNITLKMQYDYSGNDAQKMKNMNLYFFKWNTTSKFKFIFDFDTASLISNTLNGKRRQVTFLDEIAQIGVSEVNSTMQLLSENGSSVDLDGIKHEINIVSPQEACHFIKPQKDYWESLGHLETYTLHNTEIESLQKSGHYVVAEIMDQYLGNDPYIAEKTANTMDLGSYHMGLGSMQSTFEYLGDSYVCYGFNYSNDPDINYGKFTQPNNWWYNDEEATFTLPTTKVHPDVSSTVTVNILGANAFNGNISNKYDIALPIEVKKVTIPADYLEIQQYAIGFNENAEEQSQIETLYFERSSTSTICTLGANAFYNLKNLKYIDLSSFKANDYQFLQSCWKNAFKSVHINHEDLQEGTIVLPSGLNSTQIASWLENINNYLGIHAYTSSSPEQYGWALYSAQNP